MITTNYATVQRQACACGAPGHGQPVYISGQWVRLCLAHARDHFGGHSHAPHCDGRVMPIYSGAKVSDCACRTSQVWSASA